MMKKGNKPSKDASKKAAKSKLSPSGDKGMKKEYLKTKPTCKVTFRLPKESAQGAKNVTIVGDFNKWNITETKMKKLKNGDFTLTLELPCDREYSFRYLIDTNRWEKDWFADKHIPGESDVDDSIVIV